MSNYIISKKEINLAASYWSVDRSISISDWMIDQPMKSDLFELFKLNLKTTFLNKTGLKFSKKLFCSRATPHGFSIRSRDGVLVTESCDKILDPLKAHHFGFKY